jgi:hypothetical protein
MQTGTEILLARMKEYPDEFFPDLNSYDSRWGNIIDEARSCLPKEDIEALDEGYRQLRIDRFNERVLARLAGEDKQPEETLKPQNTLTANTIGAVGPTQQAYEQVLKEKQYRLDQQNRAMQNAAQGSGMMGIGGQLGKWGGGF